MNLFILFLICVNFHFNAIKANEESDEAKYIDLLPEREKKQFLEKIARRIIEEVQSQDVKLASGEISDDHLNAHSAFVSKILKEEKQNLRRGGNETEQKKKEEAPPAEEENANVQNLANDKIYVSGEDKSKPFIVDLTLRAGNRLKRYENDSTEIYDEKKLNTTEISHDITTVKAAIDEKSDNISVDVKFQEANSEINPNVTKEGHHVTDNIVAKGDHEIPVKVIYENDSVVRKENENISETSISLDIVEIVTSKYGAPLSNIKEIVIDGSENVNSSRRDQEVYLKEIQKHGNEESIGAEEFKYKENVKEERKDENITEQDTTSSKDYSLVEIEIDDTKSNEVNVSDSTVADYYNLNVSDSLEQDNSTPSVSQTTLNAEIRSKNSSANVETNFQENKIVQLNQGLTSGMQERIESSKKLDVTESITIPGGLNTSSEKVIIGVMYSTPMPHILTTNKISDIVSSEYAESSTSQTAETATSISNLLNNDDEDTYLTNAKIDISQVQTTSAPIVHSTKKQNLRLDKVTVKIEPRVKIEMTNIQSKLGKGIIPIFNNGFETQIENSKNFLALQSKYTESKVKKYEVYEIPAGETPFVQQQKTKPPKQDNHPYYVPVYNYAPNNAYFNPYNRLGPNLEDMNDENERIENRKHTIKTNDAQRINEALRTNYAELYNDWSEEDPKPKKIKPKNKPPSIINNKPKVPFDMHLLNHSDGRYLDKYLERRYKSRCPNCEKKNLDVPNSNEKDHLFNGMASMNLKDHLGFIRKVLYRPHIFGLEEEKFGKKEIPHTTTSRVATLTPKTYYVQAENQNAESKNSEEWSRLNQAKTYLRLPKFDGVLHLRLKDGSIKHNDLQSHNVTSNSYISGTTPKLKKRKKLKKGIAEDYFFGRSEYTGKDFAAKLDKIDPDKPAVPAHYWFGRQGPSKMKNIENYPIINESNGKSYINTLLNYEIKNKLYEKDGNPYINSFFDNIAGNDNNDPNIINISNGEPYINTLIDYKGPDVDKADSDVVNFVNGKPFINSFMDYSTENSHSKERINVAIGTPFNRHTANKHYKDDMLNIAIGKPLNRFIDYNIPNKRYKNANINKIAIGKPFNRINDYNIANNNNNNYNENNVYISKPYFNNYNGYKDNNGRMKYAHILNIANDKPYISNFIDYKTAYKDSIDYNINNIAIGKPYASRYVDYKPENDYKQDVISLSNGKPYITTFTDYKITNKYRTSENAESGNDDANKMAGIRPDLRYKNIRTDSKENTKKKDDSKETEKEGAQKSQSLTTDDIRTLLEMVDTKDVMPILDTIHSITRSDSGFKPYLVVIKDMVKTDADALEKYDWLGTTVDIQSALTKIKDLIIDLESEQVMNPADMQLLKYIVYLHKVSENYLTRHSERSDSMRRGRLPRNWHNHQKHRIINLSKFYWMLRTEIPGPNFREHLKEFVQFVENLELGLSNLHDAIKHISMVTKYKKQKWYQNLKQLYLAKATNKEYLSLLLHLYTSKLLSLIEESAANGLEDDFEQYIRINRDTVKETIIEFVTVLRLLTELKRIET